MAMVKVQIRDRKAVSCEGVDLGFMSGDGAVMAINGWCVQIRDDRIICDTKHEGYFEFSSYHKELIMYLKDGELFLTDGSFGRRNAYFFGASSQDSEQYDIRQQQRIGV